LHIDGYNVRTNANIAAHVLSGYQRETGDVSVYPENNPEIASCRIVAFINDEVVSF